MPIGTSDGEYYEDGMDQRVNAINIHPVSFQAQQGNFSPLPDVDYQRYESPPKSATDKDVINIPDQGAAKGGNLTRDLNEWGQEGDFNDRSHRLDVSPAGGAAILGVPELRHKMNVAAETGQLNTASRIVGNLSNIQDSFKSAIDDVMSSKPVNRLLGTGGEERYQTWPERAVRGMLDALKVPGDAYQGNLDLGSEEGRNRVFNLASLMVFPPGAKADASLGSFMGVKSRTFDVERLIKAQKMEKEGLKPDDIWAETKTFRAPDNRWKQEISDLEATVKPEKQLNSRTILQNMGTDYTKQYYVSPDWHPELGDIYDHPELYRAYPHLRNVRIVPVEMAYPNPGGIRGWASPAKSSYAISNEDTIGLAPGTLPEIKSVLAHEIQHLIQHHEGFSQGSAMNWFESENWKALKEEFGKFKGKAELDALREFDKQGENTIYSKLIEMKNAINNEDRLEDHSWQSELAGHYRDLIKEAKDTGLYDDLKKVNKGEDIMERYNDLLKHSYYATKGEVEARNVQTRMNLTNFLRTLIPPWKTFEREYPPEKQVWSPIDNASLRDLY